MRKGYERKQVDGFLRRAEESLRQDASSREQGGGAPMTAAEIRKAGFDLVRRGYDVASVDACLDQLELRALDLADAAPDSTATTDLDAAADLLAVLSQEPGQRFPRVPLLTRGYDPAGVDSFVTSLLPVLAGDAHDLEPDGVRQVVFKARRGGYAEGAVDDVLDQAIELLLRRQRGAGDTSQAQPQTSA